MMRIAFHGVNGKRRCVNGGIQDPVGAPGRKCGNPGHGRCAVDHREGFFRQISVGFESGFFHGPDGSHGFIPVKDPAFTCESRPDIGHGRQVA